MNSLLLMKTTLPWYSGLQLLPSYVYDPWLKDFFTSAIELSWFWTFLSFCTSFYISWIMFAVLWYLIVMVHGDMAADKSEDHVDCVDNVGSFTSAFLFSLETQHTIGWEL